MENIALPSKIEILPEKEKNKAAVSIQPCHPGYGITLGNALRRVLLSSLPGGAVTAFKIKGIGHEFSAIPYIKEDTVEISLNLKQLRLKIFSEEPVRLELKVKGEKKVTAKDIKTTSDVEIANPDLLIATLTNKDAELDMEIIVSRGLGYVPTESREKEETEVEMIAIDSIFTPVKNVGFQIENIRVGKMTNYENLLLDIETDGTITPEEALNQATRILIDHFQLVLDQTQTEVKPKKVRKTKEEKDEDGDDEKEKIKEEKAKIKEEEKEAKAKAKEAKEEEKEAKAKEAKEEEKEAKEEEK